MLGRRSALPSVLPLLALLLLIAGCAGSQSPAVGTWTQSLGRMTFTLVLEPGGKGTLSSPAHRGEQAINWRDENGTIHIEVEGSTSPTGRSITGNLSEDKNTLAINLGGASMTLKREQ